MRNKHVTSRPIVDALAFGSFGKSKDNDKTLARLADFQLDPRSRDNKRKPSISPTFSPNHNRDGNILRQSLTLANSRPFCLWDVESQRLFFKGEIITTSQKLLRWVFFFSFFFSFGIRRRNFEKRNKKTSYSYLTI